MALLPANFYRGQPGTSTTTLYTVTNTAGKYAIVKEIICCNVSAAAATVSISLVATGGTEVDANRIVKDLSLAVGQTVIFNLSEVIGQNETIRATQGTASAITVTISGVAN